MEFYTAIRQEQASPFILRTRPTKRAGVVLVSQQAPVPHRRVSHDATNIEYQLRTGGGCANLGVRPLVGTSNCPSVRMSTPATDLQFCRIALFWNMSLRTCSECSDFPSVGGTMSISKRSLRTSDTTCPAPSFPVPGSKCACLPDNTGLKTNTVAGSKAS